MRESGDGTKRVRPAYIIVTDRYAVDVQFTGQKNRERGREKNSWQIKFLKTTRYLL